MTPRRVLGLVTTTLPGNEFAIREATRADLLDVSRIEQASFPQPWPFQAFERFIDEPGFLVAERDGQITGYIVSDAVPNHGNALGHVKDFAVHPDFRGQGIGTELLQQALAKLGTRGVYSVKLEVRENNESAIRLYRQHGFVHKRTVSRYYNNGEDALILVRE
jgi:ribosomal-protein-alanine N-acetyltransferase